MLVCNLFSTFTICTIPALIQKILCCTSISVWIQHCYYGFKHINKTERTIKNPPKNTNPTVSCNQSVHLYTARERWTYLTYIISSCFLFVVCIPIHQLGSDKWTLQEKRQLNKALLVHNEDFYLVQKMVIIFTYITLYYIFYKLIMNKHN